MLFTFRKRISLRGQIDYTITSKHGFFTHKNQINENFFIILVVLSRTPKKVL